MKAVSIFFVFVSAMLIFAVVFTIFGITREKHREAGSTQLPQIQNSE
ncbi:MAG: hypothetical protein WC921_01645 [Candidatus Paceibacterota bacterium]